MKRPGIDSYERGELQKKLDLLAPITMGDLHGCPKCSKVLRKGETHASIRDGAYGEYTTWYCK